MEATIRYYTNRCKASIIGDIYNEKEKREREREIKRKRGRDRILVVMICPEVVSF